MPDKIPAVRRLLPKVLALPLCGNFRIGSIPYNKDAAPIPDHLLKIPSIPTVCVIFAPVAFLNGVYPEILPKRLLPKFIALAPIGCPVLAAISDPVTLERNAKTPAPLEILPH